MIDNKIIKCPDGGWAEVEHLNGKFHGLWTVYYPNGLKKSERECINDKQEGCDRSWDNDGSSIEERWYHLDELHGVRKKG